MKKVTFSVSTGMVGSERAETLTFEELAIEEDLKGDELEDALKDAFNDWLWDNINTYYEVED